MKSFDFSLAGLLCSDALTSPSAGISSSVSSSAGMIYVKSVSLWGVEWDKFESVPSLLDLRGCPLPP